MWEIDHDYTMTVGEVVDGRCQVQFHFSSPPMQAWWASMTDEQRQAWLDYLRDSIEATLANDTATARRAAFHVV